MSEETAPFLLLKLRTIDCFDSLLGLTGKAPLHVEMTVEYSAVYAALKPYERIELDIQGFKRLFALLSIEPVQVQEVSLSIAQLPSEQEPEPGEPTLDSIAQAWTGFAASKSALHNDIELLADFLERRGTTQSLAYGAAASGQN